MARHERSWSLFPAACCNPKELRHRCALAFTVSRDDLAHGATSFDQIECEETRALFHLFLEIARRISIKTGGAATCALEQVLAAGSDKTMHYTFFLLMRDWGRDNADPCDATLDEIIADAAKREEQKRLGKPHDWESWTTITSRARLKCFIMKHVRYSAFATHESGDNWSGERLGAHIVFSIPHAFSQRAAGVRAEQSVWSDEYCGTGAVRFPLPRYVYVVPDHELREPKFMSTRTLPDWQAQWTPSSAIHFVDALLAPGGSASNTDALEALPETDDGRSKTRRERLRELYERSLGIEVDMDAARAIVEKAPVYTRVHTYESLRALGLERLARIEEMAQNRSKKFADPVNAARRLYDVHQRLGIEVHAAQMRGAFPENLSPKTNEIMRWAENHLFTAPPLVSRAREFSDLDRFCNRELWRWREFSETYLVAPHNLNNMMLVNYCSLDANSYDQITGRVGLNILFHTETPGVGKSLMIMNLTQEMRIQIHVVTYGTAKRQAVSSEFGEQCGRINIMEEISEALVSARAGGDSEAARILKTMLTNPTMIADYLQLDRETGARIPCSAVSRWIQVLLAAANIKRMRSVVLEEAMDDRVMVITLDQSEKAKQAILAKKQEADMKLLDSAFVKSRAETSEFFRKEEFIYTEKEFLVRESAMRRTSFDVISTMCSWLSTQLVRLGHPACIRNRDKICALASIIAGVDAVDAVYFDRGGVAADKPYDVHAQPQVERRAWVKAAHAVHAIGMAPHLFLDVDERDVRLALCYYFESLRRTPERFEAVHGSGRATSRAWSGGYSSDEASEDEIVDSGRDYAFVRITLGRSGLPELALRLRAQQANITERRMLLTLDAIEFCLKKWTGRQIETRDWTLARGEQWPSEDADSAQKFRPIARLDRSAGCCVYYVQTAWIHRDTLPRPADEILLSLMRGFFAHRHQGGFSAPYGADGNRLRIVKFPRAAPDARLLVMPGASGSPATQFETDVDMWGLEKHNARLYISKSPIRKLGSCARESDCEQYFSGRPLDDLLAKKAVDRQRALAELIAEPENGCDDDAPDRDFRIGEREDGSSIYPWDAWCTTPDDPRWVTIDPEASAEERASVHARNRGEYKCIAAHPLLEDALIAAKTAMPENNWTDASRRAKKRKRVKVKNLSAGSMRLPTGAI